MATKKNNLFSFHDLTELVEKSPIPTYNDSSLIMFTVQGKPRAKQRPRLTKNGHAFTPQATLNYENWVKECYLMQNKNHPMLVGELVAEIVAFYPIPASKSKGTKEKMENDDIRPKSKPDLDNIAKSILDALNDIAYKDDSQVVRLVIEKRYAQEPRVEVCIYARHFIEQ